MKVFCVGIANFDHLFYVAIKKKRDLDLFISAMSINVKLELESVYSAKDSYYEDCIPLILAASDVHGEGVYVANHHAVKLGLVNGIDLGNQDNYLFIAINLRKAFIESFIYDFI